MSVWFQMQLLPWTDLLRAMQKCLPFPYNNTIDGPPFEKLVAISIASTAHLFSAGVTTVSPFVMYTLLSFSVSVLTLRRYA